MKREHPIFRKMRLRPAQLRTVADRRYADAVALRATNHNDRANGVMYLAGFVIECLLKAHLLEAFPQLQHAVSAQSMPAQERQLWSLCYRSHDLDEILARLPTVTQRLQLMDQRGNASLVLYLRSICAQWTIFARYSPHSATMSEAMEFLDRVRELKQWLQ